MCRDKENSELLMKRSCLIHDWKRRHLGRGLLFYHKFPNVIVCHYCPPKVCDWNPRESTWTTHMLDNES